MDRSQTAAIAALIIILATVELEHAGLPHVPHSEPTPDASAMAASPVISPTGVVDDHVWTLDVDELGFGTVLG